MQQAGRAPEGAKKQTSTVIYPIPALFPLSEHIFRVISLAWTRLAFLQPRGVPITITASLQNGLQSQGQGRT